MNLALYFGSFVIGFMMAFAMVYSIVSGEFQYDSSRSEKDIFRVYFYKDPDWIKKRKYIVLRVQEKQLNSQEKSRLE